METSRRQVKRKKKKNKKKIIIIAILIIICILIFKFIVKNTNKEIVAEKQIVPIEILNFQLEYDNKKNQTFLDMQVINKGEEKPTRMIELELLDKKNKLIKNINVILSKLEMDEKNRITAYINGKVEKVEKIQAYEIK